MAPSYHKLPSLTELSSPGTSRSQSKLLFPTFPLFPCLSTRKTFLRNQSPVCSKEHSRLPPPQTHLTIPIQPSPSLFFSPGDALTTLVALAVCPWTVSVCVWYICVYYVGVHTVLCELGVCVPWHTYGGQRASQASVLTFT